MPKLKELPLNIEGMHCASCVNSIEKGVRSLDGVDSCRVNLAMNSAVVTFDNERLDPEQVIGRIKELGFDAEISTPDVLTRNTEEVAHAWSRFSLALVLTIPLIIAAMWPMVFNGYLASARVDGIIQAAIAAIVIFYAGRSILHDAWIQTVHFRANMNSLIAMGTLTAFGWSTWVLVRIFQGDVESLYFDSAGMIITLILLGRYLEARSKGKAGQAIQALLNLRPSGTTAIIDGSEVYIEAAQVQPGMTVLVKPGERIPADGEITEGQPVIDESMLTGESVPVEKKPGDTAIGGSLNGNVPFQMKVSAAGEKSFLAQVIRLVADAQSRKAPVQSLADKVASVFVPFVIGCALVTLAIWYFVAPDSPLLIRSVVSVLIIACPCALGLATPTAVLAGTGRAARDGIIIRGGDVLEKLSNIDTVVFDKTGTLTYGELEVVDVKTFGHVSEQSLIRLVGSIESQSEHPVAQAIVRRMKRQQVETAVVRNVISEPGFGMTGECDNRQLVVGNRKLMEAREISFGPALMQGEQEMEKGRTVVFAAVDGQVIGIMSLADRLRGDARDLIAELKDSMTKVTMLSGDNRKTAEGVARTLGLDSYEAEIRPDQKKLIVESLRKAGFKVAMVGDGINDAPALAAATVGVAIGSGTDVALEAADVVLVRSNLMDVRKMFEVSRQSMSTIKQNLFWAFFYNVIAIPVAAGVLYPIAGITMSPVLAALAMSFSSVFVVTNSLRLSRLELN